MKHDEIGIGIQGLHYTYDMGNKKQNELCGNDSATSGYYDVCHDRNKKIPLDDFNKSMDDLKDKAPKIVVWPPDGQSDIPPAFFEETPDPLPDYNVSGYPTSVEFITPTGKYTNF